MLNVQFYKGEYRQLRGMYPTAAGKLACHGPYAKVSDIYSIPNLSRKFSQLNALVSQKRLSC